MLRSRWLLVVCGLVACGVADLPAPGVPDRAGPLPAADARPAAPTRPLRVVVVSDLNGSYGARHYSEAVHGAVARVVERRPDLVLSTGDMVAGQRGGLDYERMWSSFHTSVSDRLAAARIPFAVSPGNHDASGYPAFAHERAVYVEQWYPRRPDLEFVDAREYPLRYSFVAGPALFVALDSTTVGPLSDEQMRWLDRQLAAGGRRPKIVFGHVPLYPFAVGRRSEHIGDGALEHLLVRHEVALFVSGHHHAYYPGRRGDLRLVSTACLGAGARRLLGTNVPSERSILSFEVDADGVHAIDAFGGEAFDRPVDRAGLPQHVGHGPMRIDRDDLPLVRR